MHLSLAQSYTTRYIGVHAVTTNEPDEPKGRDSDLALQGKPNVFPVPH